MPKEKNADVLPEGQVRFDMLTETLRDLGKDMKAVSESNTRMVESTKSLWHEVRDNLRPEIRELSGEVRNILTESDLDRHSTNCPARIHYMRKAQTTEPSSGLDFSKLPKGFYLFMGIGVVIGVAFFVVYKLGIFG